MTTENQLLIPTLEALDRSLIGELTTTQLRGEVKERITMTANDLEPLKNRNDRKIDQIIRNLKSHKEVVGNPVHDGLLEDVPRGFRITSKGREYLKKRMK